MPSRNRVSLHRTRDADLLSKGADMTPSDSRLLEQLDPGMSVVGLDSRTVGRVHQIGEDRFSVVRTDGTLVWMPPSLIFAVQTTGVMLICHAATAERYLCPPPDRAHENQHAHHAS